MQQLSRAQTIAYACLLVILGFTLEQVVLLTQHFVMVRGR